MPITINNEISCAFVACEVIIICSERDKAYNTMIQFVSENSNKRTSQNIHVIAADEFMNQDCVTNKFRLQYATHMCGICRLFNSILPKHLDMKHLDL